MTRFRLTIQKKFLLLIMAVGLIPAALGTVMTAVGGRYSFAWAMGTALESRARQLAGKLDDLCEDQEKALAEIIRRRGDDLEGIRKDAATLGTAEVLVRYRSADDFIILPFESKGGDPKRRVRQLALYFDELLRSGKVTPDGYFDSLPVQSGDADSSGGWVICAYPSTMGGGLVFFLIQGDHLLQKVRASSGEEEDLVLFYSRGKGFLTSNPGPFGLQELVQKTLTNPSVGMTGILNLRGEESGRRRQHLIAYSISQRLSRLASVGQARSPVVVLIAYDMETFLGPQSWLLWFSVVAALVWALLLMALAVVSARRIVGPVKALRRQAEAMAGGNLDVRAAVRTHDEIHDLADAFNAMAEKLRASRDQIMGFNKELEQKIEERTRELARANQVLLQTEKHAATGRLAANLAHEINNPLGIIKNYLRLVTDAMTHAGGGRRASDPNLDRIKVINEELDRIARIVRQLLDLHRPVEHGVAETDLNSLLEEIVALMEKGLAKENIKIEREYERNLPRLMVAPDLMRQAFLNLLRNANDAMENGGTLTIKTETRSIRVDGKDHPAVAVSITDTGCGIPRENLDRIFDPFFTTKSAEKGTGLGLAVSYGIARMYQGTIEVATEPGKGTTFTVTLPLDEPRPTAESQQVGKAQP